MTLYTDDSVLYFPGKTSDVMEEKLNSDLEQIANWFVQNNLRKFKKYQNRVCPLWYTPENFGIQTFGN